MPKREHKKGVPESLQPPQGLRRRSAEARQHVAEEILCRLKASPVLARQTERLLAELHEYQAELEAQNGELQRVQADLEQSRQNYVDLYDGAPVGYFTLDSWGAMLNANLTGATMLGQERDRIVGRSFAEFIALDDRLVFAEHLKSVFGGRGRHACEVRLALAESPVPARLDSVYVDDHGQSCCRTTVIDISDRVRAAKAESRIRLQEAEERFGALLEAAPDVILLVGPDGRIALVNSQTERLFGYRREELLGQPIEMLIPEHVRQRHATHRVEYAAVPTTRPMGAGLALTARRKDGSEFPVEISLSPMTTPESTMVISILRDVTEQKRASAQLQEQAQVLEAKVREMDDFIHVVSHDLKEPLRGIEAFSGFLLEDYADRLDEQGKQYLGFLRQSALRMKDLIHDLLTLAALSHKSPTRQPVDLDRVMAAVQRDLEYSIRHKRAEVRTEGPLPTVVGDPTLIGEVLKNLVSNAIKFNVSDRPVVTISAHDDDNGFARLAVADNGIGIDPQYRDRIFELFERLHRQEEFEGTGAGLAICKKIVEGYGGRIWVESEPGKGSTFLLTVPASPRGVQ
jgi:PAS domain S-box-containing protein